MKITKFGYFSIGAGLLALFYGFVYGIIELTSWMWEYYPTASNIFSELFIFAFLSAVVGFVVWLVREG